MLDAAVAAPAMAPLSQTMMLRVLGQTRRSLGLALAAVVVAAVALLLWSQLQNRKLQRGDGRPAARRARRERAT